MRLVAALLVLACFASAESKDPKDSKAPEDPNAQDRKKAEKLLKDAETQKGFLTLHRKEGKVYAELAEADFGRSFLCFESISRGVGRGWVLGGMTLDDLILSFRRISKKTVQVLRQNPRFRADKGSPMERAVSHSFGPSVLASLPVAARHPDRKTVIVDLGPLFLTDMPDVATPLKEAFEQAYKLDAGRSSWGEAKVFPKNVELEVFLSFSASELKDLETVPDSRHVEVGVHYSLYRLPENGYRPRLADDRVGHFLTAVRDFSRPGLSSFVRYVTRWHLQKADPAAAVSPPKDPLVFWIENTVPHRYRRVVRDGILEWNRAFARIGISDAIEVRQMEEDADWDPEDARYNCFRWITSSRLSFGAIGPSRVDPRTGQILDADILYEAENLRGLLWSYQRHHLPRSDAGAPEPYFLAHEAPRPVILRGACDLAVLRVPDLDFARTAFWLRRPGRPVPEEYIVQGLKETVTHEVGHVLGLRHNFKASMIVDLDELDDRERAEREGLFGSVMEYNPPNVARDPERQGYYFTPTLGAYDHWAIEYGYKPIPADREAEELARIAARCDEPDLAYATDGDARGAAQIDPEATIFDLSSDPVAWCRDRIGLCEDLWKADWSALNVEGFGYRLHRSAMRALLRTYRRSLEIAARWVGGTVTNRRHPGDEGAPFHNVPIHKQREALDLVVEKGLAPGLLRFPPELLNRLAVNRFRHWGLDRQTEYEFPLHQRIREMRLALLRRLHGQAVLRHMDEARSRALPGEPAMTIREVLERVREAVWSGVAGGGAVPADRRDLQADHVEILAQLFLHPESYPRDAHVLARSLLRDVTSLCARALKAPELEVETRAHLQAVSARVQAVLGVSLSRAVR